MSMIDKLREISQTVDLSDRYLFNFDHNLALFSEEERNRLGGAGSIFQKNEELKFILNQKITDAPTEELYFWIINDWGGIKGFKKTQSNKGKIATFLRELQNGRTSRLNFQVISSLSKIASLYDVKKYAIYDSKVIYSLNWLLLKYDRANKFFPMPSGRNKIIVNYGIDTILRFLALQDDYGNLTFYKSKDAYQEYCELIRRISLEVWDDELRREHPFYMEMLLWVIADNEIFSDIKDTIRITLLE